MARPTKYKHELCEDAEGFLGEGHSLSAWAGSVGIARDTAYEWMAQHEEFSDAIKRGRAKGQGVWEKRLMHLAITGEGNATAIIFSMKNLYPDDWRDKQHIEKKTTHEAGDSVATLMKAINGRTRSL